MNPRTRKLSVAGPAGAIECMLDEPESAGQATQGAQTDEALGTALLCHPHPLHGGTLDNKVVQTLARAFVQLGWRALRFNLRGVGASAGHWDDGSGEIDDAMAVLKAFDAPGHVWAVGGFSFGGYVATHVAARLALIDRAPRHLVLVGPAVASFAPADVSSPSLVVHGQADEVVPLHTVFDWARSQALPVTVVPGAAHFFHGQLNLLKSIVTHHCRA